MDKWGRGSRGWNGEPGGEGLLGGGSTGGRRGRGAFRGQGGGRRRSGWAAGELDGPRKLRGGCLESAESLRSPRRSSKGARRSRSSPFRHNARDVSTTSASPSFHRQSNHLLLRAHRRPCPVRSPRREWRGEWRRGDHPSRRRGLGGRRLHWCALTRPCCKTVTNTERAGKRVYKRLRAAPAEPGAPAPKRTRGPGKHNKPKASSAPVAKKRRKGGRLGRLEAVLDRLPVEILSEVRPSLSPKAGGS